MLYGSCAFAILLNLEAAFGIFRNLRDKNSHSSSPQVDEPTPWNIFYMSNPTIHSTSPKGWVLMHRASLSLTWTQPSFGWVQALGRSLNLNFGPVFNIRVGLNHTHMLFTNAKSFLFFFLIKARTFNNS